MRSTTAVTVIHTLRTIPQTVLEWLSMTRAFASLGRAAITERERPEVEVQIESLHGDGFDLVASTPDGEYLGDMRIQRFGPHKLGNRSEGPALMRVVHARATEPGLGIGTKLYEAAARVACRRFRLPLASDTARSSFSEGFWQKQVRKGRASCLATATREDVTSRNWHTIAQRHGIKRLGYPERKGECWSFILSCPEPKSLARAM